MTLFEALTGGAFDRLTGNIAGNLTKFFQKSQMPRGLPGGGGMGGFVSEDGNHLLASNNKNLQKRMDTSIGNIIYGQLAC